MRMSDGISDGCSSDLQYIYPDGTSGIITCQTAYTFISAGWNSYYAVAAPKIAAQFFPGIPAAQATARLNNDMIGMGAAGMASSSGQLVRQAMFIKIGRAHV